MHVGRSLCVHRSMCRGSEQGQQTHFWSPLVCIDFVQVNYSCKSLVPLEETGLGLADTVHVNFFPEMQCVCVCEMANPLSVHDDVESSTNCPPSYLGELQDGSSTTTMLYKG